MYVTRPLPFCAKYLSAMRQAASGVDLLSCLPGVENIKLPPLGSKQQSGHNGAQNERHAAELGLGASSRLLRCAIVCHYIRSIAERMVPIRISASVFVLCVCVCARVCV